MVARPANPVRSANAGEFSREVAGRVDIKQYYSAGLACKNIEPVPQGGFRRMGGSWRVGKWRRPLVALAIADAALAAGPHEGTATIWTGTIAGSVAAVLCSGLAIDDGSATFSVEAFVAGAWTLVGGPFAVSLVTPVTRLAALAPGAQKAATALRIVATFSTAASVTDLTVSAFSEDGVAVAPRHTQITTDDGDVLNCFVSGGIADFWAKDGFKGAARLSDLTTDMLADLGFYAEGRTIGVFHDWLRSVRLFLASAVALQDWRDDDWPYDPVPKADLGGDYVKTDDVWELMVRWSASGQLTLTVTVNDETTPGVTLQDDGGAPTTTGSATPTQWAVFANNVAAAISALPSIGAPVTIISDAGDSSAYHHFVITFGGVLAGQEYGVTALVVNNGDMSALAYHTQTGTTELEDLFSVTRGWPGGATLVQDRMAYYRIPAASGAVAMSKIGEYFDLNTEGSTDAAARLDRLRSQTSETILHVHEGGYIFMLTDRGAYFLPNRTIERNQPLNFVSCSQVGAQPNCLPFDLEGGIYYVAIAEGGMPNRAAGGNQLLRLDESSVTSQTSFEANGVSLLASHLVAGIIRSARQKARGDLDASKGWLMRADGRLVAGQFIKNQDITGFCEWIAAAGGKVREIGVDGANDLWLAVMRMSGGTIERYDPDLLLQDAVTATADLAGVVTGLPYEEGAVLWAVADGYVLGPFTCAGGSVDLRDPYTAVTVGRWQAPRWESMPQVFVTGNDDVLWRPGRIHTLRLNVIDTSSVAVGANGAAPVDIVLSEVGDLVDQPVPPKTMAVTVTGEDMPGYVEGTTAVVTQLRPGELYVRDLAIGAKL